MREVKIYYPKRQVFNQKLQDKKQKSVTHSWAGEEAMDWFYCHQLLECDKDFKVVIINMFKERNILEDLKASITVNQ